MQTNLSNFVDPFTSIVLTSLLPVCVAFASDDSIASKRLSFLLKDFERLSWILPKISNSSLEFSRTISALCAGLDAIFYVLDR